ncbi:hypothetical protein [Pirellulimonas nuda]|uniref:hypothetical protein n=1 Tax=Pirellulimonas nuda TaxID=2528009 RepID=UPI00119E54D3|nr:hypothetical protein [Pirellulimonas nuda]
MCAGVVGGIGACSATAPPGCGDEDDLLSDPKTKAIIRRVSQKLASSHPSLRAEKEDFEQDLYLKLWSSAERRGSGEGGRYAFVKTVAQRLALNIRRDRFAAKRDCRRQQPLDLDLSASSEALATEEDPGLYPDDLAKLRAGLEAAAKGLSDKQQEYVRLIQDGQTRAAAARKLGVPHSTAEGWWRRFYWLCEEEGLGQLLD